MSGDFDLDAFRAAVDASLERGHEAFVGRYKRQLNDLAGLSREEIDRIAPGLSDLQKYDELVSVVKVASRHNVATAELKQQIVRLGKVAVDIAERVPSVAALLA
jgi:hypothetical protein